MFVIGVEAGVGLRAGSCYDEEFEERVGLQRGNTMKVKGERGRKRLKLETQVENIGRVIKGSDGVLRSNLGGEKGDILRGLEEETSQLRKVISENEND